MFPATIILALTILGFAAWLEWRERDASQHPSVFHEAYLAKRRRGRLAVHILLGITGALVLITGFVPRGVTWVALWSAVCGLLVLVVTFAMLDFWRTHRYLYREVPELRRQMFHSSFPSQQEGSPPPPSSSESSESSGS